MNRILRYSISLFAVCLLAFSAVTAVAQETTSAIRGRILDNAGEPVPNAAIVVQDLRTGVTRQYSTNNAGTFLATNLPVGGPYQVTVNEVKSVVIDYISLGDTYNLSVNLQSAAQNYTGPCCSFRQNVGHLVVGNKSVHHPAFLPGGDENVEVTDGFPGPPIAAGCDDLFDFRDLFQIATQ